MGAAVLRSGYLGKPDYYGGFNYNEDAYELFSLEAPPVLLRDQRESRFPGRRALSEVHGCV